MERLYDYCVSYTTGSIGIFNNIQQLLLFLPKGSTATESIGLVVSIMQNNLKLLDFAISMTVYWLSLNSSKLFKGSCTLTLIFIMETELKRLFI